MDWYSTTRPMAVFVADGMREQVERELAFFRQLGFIGQSDDTFLAADGKTYPLPGADNIIEICQKQWADRYELKVLQGFDTPRITLFVGLPKLMGTLGEVLVARKDDLRSAWNDKLQLNSSEPVWTNWNDQPPLKYRLGGKWVDPAAFFAGGSFPGCRVDLIRSADRELLRSGMGKALYGRPDTAGGKSPQDLRPMFGAPPYEHEHAYSPDGNLMYYIRSVHEDGIVPDVYTDKRGTLCWCPDAQFETKDMESASARVPIVYFALDSRRVSADWYYAYNRNERFAVRGAVGIEEL